VNSRTKARVLSALVLAVLFGLDHHNRTTNRHALGKESFLAYEGRYFDRFYAKPSHPLFWDLSSVIFMGTVFGGYELLAFGTYKLINSGEDRDGT
jgi:hypothetical protein